MHIAMKNMAIRYALLHMFFLFSLAVATSSNSTITTKPDCQSSCGNVEIPYPFGIGTNCSMNQYFNINCNTSFNPPKPYLSFVNVNFEEVLNIETIAGPAGVSSQSDNRSRLGLRNRITTSIIKLLLVVQV
ncbi:unnamed protein product [Fraxinus pennsylvanica]|uniref:Wall-associated receptor kinase galacturonan-binding domain-containing protein n=1 Tax=Fraxinus pennsylvanica TaxID=56036 RepID=A0AAD1ZH46_9LAMI|nr:unnamed protein product [Fraxinus pennsylvanica]